MSNVNCDVESYPFVYVTLMKSVNSSFKSFQVETTEKIMIAE